MSSMGVYQVRNIVNNKVYIGSSVNIQSRLSRHKHDLTHGKSHNSELQKSYNKYRAKAFIFEVVDITISKNKLRHMEQYHIDRMKATDKRYGYNICPCAHGLKLATSTKAKISKGMRNKRNALGAKRTEEAKRKIGLASLGNKYSLGFKHSVETKNKMSLVKLGNKYAVKNKI